MGLFIMDESELQYMRAERQRAMSPSVYDRGFEEGTGEMGNSWDNDNDWSTGGTDLWDSTPSSSSDDDIWGTGGGSNGADMWGSGGSSNGADMWGAGGGNSFEQGSFANQYSTPYMPGGAQQQPAATNATDEFEDKVFNGVINGGKVVVNAVKESGKAAKTFGVYNARGMGKQLIITGGLCALLGFLACVLNTSMWFHYVTGGIVTAGIGVTLMMIAQGRIEAMGLSNVAPADVFDAEPAEQQQVQGTQQASLPDNGNGGTDVSDSSWGDWDTGDDSTDLDDSSGANSWSTEPDSTDNSNDDWPTWEDNDSNEGDGNNVNGVLDIDADTDNEADGDNNNITDEQEVDVQSLVSNIDLPRGVITRQFIYERVTKVFKHITKNYADVEILDEDSSEFDMWLGYLNEAVDSLKSGADSKEARPVLVKVRKKLFYYILEINNKGVKGIKIDKLISSLVSLYAYDKDTNKLNPAVYGTGNDVGGMFYIKIMRGSSVSVSIEDLLVANKDFFLNTKNEFPCGLGLDIDGDPVLVDLLDVNALLITGEPRSGKSWALRNIMIQLMLFGSPRDVCFYICDPKDSISDYVRFRAPHIRRFESQDGAILETLRELVKVEGPRRKQVLSEAGCYKIQEYRAMHPNVDFPYVYVLIDEIVTLSERMDKDTKNEFQGLLMELVTQFPATGLRLILVPHIVKDDIIKKSISQNMPCRISVRGTPEHIELCTGMKCGNGEGQFPYKLTKVGDMAVNMKAGNDTIQNYVHSAVVGATSEASDAAFDFVDALWRGIEGIPMDKELRVTRGSSIGVNMNSNLAGMSVGAAPSTSSSQTQTMQTVQRSRSNNSSTNIQSVQNSGFTYTVEDNMAGNIGATPNTSTNVAPANNTTSADDDFVDYENYNENIW